MKNIFKKATALLLSLLMVFSVCSTALVVYAASGTTAVSLGTSDWVTTDNASYTATAEGKLYIKVTALEFNRDGWKKYQIVNFASEGFVLTVNGTPVDGVTAELFVEENETVEISVNLPAGIKARKFKLNLQFVEGIVNYVSIGDSMTNGYGLEGYEEPQDDGTITNWFGFQRNEVEGSYPYKVADHFGWKLSQIATSGLRADDVYYLLTLGTDYEVNWDEYGRQYMAEKFKQSYKDATGKDGSDDEIIAWAAKQYQAEVKDADVISIGIGSNNFATLMDMRMMWWLGKVLGDESMFSGGGYQGAFDFNELVGDLSDAERAQIATIYAEVEALLSDSVAGLGLPTDHVLAASTGETIGDFIKDFANAIAYTSAGFALGYKGIVDTIIRENPDAEIIIVGLTNWFRGMVYGLPIPGTDETLEVPVGELMETVCDFAGSYMAALPALYETIAQIDGIDLQPIYFADTNAEGVDEVELIIDEIVKNTSNVDLKSLEGLEGDARFAAAKAIAQNITSEAIPSGTVRDRLLEAMGGYVLSMMGMRVPTMADVEAYEAYINGGYTTQQDCYIAVTFGGNEVHKQTYYIEGQNHADTSAYLHDKYGILPETIALEDYVTEDELNAILGGANPAQYIERAIYDAIYNAVYPYYEGCIAYLGLEKSMISSLHLDVVNVDHFKVLSSVEKLMSLTWGALEPHMSADPNDIAGALIAVPELGTISNLMFNFLVGSGVIVHPSDAGHTTIANVIIDSYEGEYTAQDKFVDDFNRLIAHINARYDEAYAYAWAYAKQNGYIDAAIASIDAAIEGINDAIAAVEAYDTEYVDVKAALIAELEATKATLESIKPIISTDDVDNAVAQIITLAGELDAHFENIKALATAIGVEIDPYIATAISAANTYAELVDYTVKAAYEWLVNNVIAINDAYITFVEETGAYADEIDPALGVAVRKFLYETPADTIAIIAAYGEEAVALLISTAAATAKDLYAAAGALANTIKEYGPVIYNAIVTNDECQALYELVVELTAQIAALALEAEAAPISTSVALYKQIDALQEQLNIAATQLYVAAIEAVNIVDPVAGEALTKSLEALCAALELVDGTVIGYFDALDANAIAMGGKLLAALAANWDEFASVAGPIIDGKIWMLIDFVKEYITNYDYNALLDKVVAEAIKLAPQVDEALYNYFYNNPEEVIAFFEKYGPCMIELAAEYGDIALGVVGIAFYMYGEDMVDYIVNNPKEVVEGIIAWADKYGERTVELLQVYAEATGLCDIVRGEIANLEGKLEQLQAELVKQYQILEAQIKPQLEALYKQLDEAAEPYKQPILDAIAQLELQKAVIEKYIAELQGMIEVVIANIDVLNVKLQNLVAALYNLDDAIKALVEAGIEAGIGAVAEALDAVGAAVVDLIGVVSQDAAAQVDAFIAKAKELLEISYNNATHADYKVNKDSYYVAFGNGEYVEGFAALIAEKVKENGVSYKFNDLTSDATISALLGDITANIADVAKADLISIGYNLDTIAENTLRIALELIMIGETTLPTEFDWEALAGADAAAEIEKVLAEVYATLIAQGLDKSLVDMGLPVDSDVKIADAAYAAVEYFAYNAVEYAIVMPQAVYAINEINPDALIMINAISNPLAGAKINLLGLEFAFGDYLNYVCDALYVETLAIAALNENVVFVPATKVETTFTNKTIGFEKFNFDTFAELDALIKGLMLNELINATEEGNAYIAEQMFAALNITVESTGLLGDVNGDGKITSADAVWILRYVVKMLDQYPDVALDFALADVNADGVITSADAVYILRYTVGLISSFDEAK